MAREPHFAYFRFSGRQPVVLAEFANGVARIFNGGFLDVHAAFVCFDVEVEHELAFREHESHGQNDEHEHYCDKNGRMSCTKRCHDMSRNIAGAFREPAYDEHNHRLRGAFLRDKQKHDPHKHVCCDEAREHHRQRHFFRIGEQKDERRETCEHHLVENRHVDFAAQRQRAYGEEDKDDNGNNEEFDSEIERRLACRHKGPNGPQREKGDEKPGERAPFHGFFDIVDERVGRFGGGLGIAGNSMRLFNKGMGHKRKRCDRECGEQQCRDVERDRCYYEA